MGLTKTEKQGWERYFVHGDFSDVMEAGETLVVGDATFTATYIDSEGVEQDATADVLDTAAAYVVGHLIYVRVIDGAEANSPYHLTIRVETSNGNRWEVDGELKVKEI